MQAPDNRSYGLWGSLFGGIAGFLLAYSLEFWPIFTVMLTWGGAAFFGQLFPSKTPEQPATDPYSQMKHGLHNF